MRAKAMMVVGTSSHAGKSWMATAICRSLRRRGVSVAPFKAQNMSLNSYPCIDGGEIGRAQVVQAEACGLAPVADMNPILLKPTSHVDSQVIVNGRVWKQLSAADYYAHYDFLHEQVGAAFERLAAKYEFIVMEGAGSASEINLRSRDLVNLPLAVRFGVPALLVADIDRGGVFASVVGTFALLESCENEWLRGFAINKFRGDRTIFGDGCETLERHTGRPCLGLFPYADDIRLDQEDIVSLEDLTPSVNGSGLRIAIVQFPRISNFTDFRLLPEARYISEPSREIPDCIILPGSKNTLEDMQWLRARGFDRWILGCHALGTAVWGICGGFQMLGKRICDPAGVESGVGVAEGLGLLPVETVLGEQKTTRVVKATCALNEMPFEAYEIHMGETKPSCEDPFAWIDGQPEGYSRDGVVGTYLHGALETPAVLAAMLSDVAQRRGKDFDATAIRSYSKDEQYERLADWFEQNVSHEQFEKLYLKP